MQLEELRILISAQTQGLTRQLNEVSGQLRGLERTTDATTKKMALSFGKVAKVIAAIGIGKIIASSIREGMDAIESENLFQESFKGSAAEIRKWSEELQSALGLNGYEVRKFAGTLYTMTNSMGLAQNTSKEVSKDLTKLAYDMASFYNLSADDAFAKLRSGLTGQSEPLKALGILIDEGTIKQVAYRNGIAATGAELTQQQKVLARYYAIMEQTTAAQGDLARTADSPANMMRRLRTELQLLRISLGQAFMPIVSIVIPYLIGMIKHLQIATAYVSAFMRLLFGVKTDAMQGMAEATKQVAANMGGVSGDFSDSVTQAKKLKSVLSGFDEVNSIASPDVGGSADVGGIAPINIDNSLVDSMQKLTDQTDEIQKKVEKAYAGFKKWLPLIAAIGAAAGFILFLANIKKIGMGIFALGFALEGLWRIPLIGKLLAPIGGMFQTLGANLMVLGEKLGVFSMAATKGAGMFSASFAASFAIVAAIIVAVIAALVQLWKNNEEFRNKVIAAWTSISETMMNLWNSMLKPVFDNLMTILGIIWEEAIKPLWEAFVLLVEQLVYLFIEIWNQLEPLVNWLITYVGPVIAEIINWIVAIIGVAVMIIIAALRVLIQFITWLVKVIIETLGPLVTFIKSALVGAFSFLVEMVKGLLYSFSTIISDVFGGIKKIFSGIIDFITGVFTGNWKKAFQGLADIVGGVFDTLVGVVKFPLNLIITAVNAMIEGLNKLKIDVPDWVPVMGGKSFGFSIPKIPKLARGGIVDSAQLFVAGEAGKEVVMPLENNTGWISQLAEKVSERMPQGGGFGSDRPVEIIVKVGSTELARAAIDSINKLQRQEGQLLIDLL